jgi:hypothetical protein
MGLVMQMRFVLLHRRLLQAYHPARSMPALGFVLKRQNLGPMVGVMHLVRFVEWRSLRAQCSFDAGPDLWPPSQWLILKA